MKSLTNILFFITLVAIIVMSCNKDENDGDKVAYDPTPTTIDYPFNFPTMKIPDDNQPTLEGIALGRALYYDPILDKDQSRSCSSCHNQEKAFTTPESNSLAHINLGWSNSYLWNGAYQESLENIMMFEVNEFFETNIDLLNKSPEYKRKFKEAYGVNTITSKDVAYALAQFFRTLNSYDSKFDKWLRGEEGFTFEEYEGYEIFISETGDCFHCHGTVLFHDNGFGNNGLDISPDPGRYAVTGDRKDFGRFKTPTLRNIELTGPYMHDGRYETLEEVVEFYSSGVQHDSPNLSPLMKYSAQGGVQMNEEEKASLVAFLKTLTDYDFITREELSNPH